LANGVQFGDKEKFMADFNPFILSNLEKINSFFDAISTQPENSIPTALYSEDDKYIFMSIVVKNLLINFEKLENVALKDPRTSDPQKAAELKRQLEETKTILSSE
jgi:hypothetical protein